MSTPFREAPDAHGAPHGWCVRRVPNKPVRREADGRIAIPLWLRQGRRFDGDVVLRLSTAEAELLHAQLCYALSDLPPTGTVPHEPDCRSAGPPAPGG